MGGDLNGLSACIRAFGCQMNIYDSEVVIHLLEQAGCTITADTDTADIVILYTCSVRAHAEDRVFSLIGSLRAVKERRGGRPVIGIMGCTAEKLGSEYTRRFDQVDFVIGTHHIETVVDTVTRALAGERPVIRTGLKAHYTVTPAFGSRTSAYAQFVPVARGCSRACTYCIVPSLRGSMSSRPAGEVIDHVKQLVDRGCRDVTLLGQNVDAYGRDTGERGGLAALLAEAAGIAGLRRVAFITSHPADFKDDILEVMQAHPVIARFFHLPPQSGSDAVLRRMKRGYTSGFYLDLAARIRAALPDAELAGDFIVGFPGETGADFEASVALARAVRFQQAYIFKYSPREGTAAAVEMEDDVPLAEKQRRNSVLLKTQEEIQLARHNALVGQRLDIVVEGPSKRDAARYFGRTSTNFRVVYAPRRETPGDLVTVEIRSATALTLFGERV